MADLIGGDLCSHFPWAGQTAMRYDSAAENILEQTWKPQLAVIGAEGLPELQHAGNVLRSETALRLSIRIPPYTEPQAALDAMRAKLTSDVPFNAQASLEDASIAKDGMLRRKRPGLPVRWKASDGKSSGNLGLHPRGRLHSDSQSLCPDLSAGTVCGHRCTRTALQCPWSRRNA